MDTNNTSVPDTSVPVDFSRETKLMERLQEQADKERISLPTLLYRCAKNYVNNQKHDYPEDTIFGLTPGEAESLLKSRVFPPPLLPLGWTKLPKPAVYDGTIGDAGVYQRYDGLRVIVTDSPHPFPTGYWYRHVSMSFKDKLPSYEHMKSVKEIFIGTSRTAVQVFPPRQNHINIHNYCLHLFSCHDADILPDFTEGLGTI